MKVRVSFRFNRTTGTVETFNIDHEGARLAGSEHDRQHEEIAAELGRLIARDPRIDEMFPGGAISAAEQTTPEAPQTEESQEEERRPDVQEN